MITGTEETVGDYREVRKWLTSLLDSTKEEITPEIDKAMQELWKQRESVFGERRAIVHAFEAVLDYEVARRFSTPYYFEKRERLDHLWQEVLRRARELKEYVEEYGVSEEREIL